MTFAQVRKAAAGSVVAFISALIPIAQTDAFDVHRLTGAQVSVLYGAILTGWSVVYHIPNAVAALLPSKAAVEVVAGDALDKWADDVLAKRDGGRVG